MNIEEIVNRNDNSSFEQGELAFVIERYIYEKKGIMVKINPLRRVPNHPILIKAVLQKQIRQLNLAYNVARQYFLNKEV